MAFDSKTLTQGGPNAPSAFTEYVNAFRRALMPAKVTPLVDPHRPDNKLGAGPYVGTVGVFHAPPAIMPVIGQWDPNYQGNTPVSKQPVIDSPDPWKNDG